MMSLEAEEDTELRDLVANTLHSLGVLGKIKAQLRSNIYLAMEGDNELKAKSGEVNATLDDFMSTSEGRLAALLVREFLQFFNLDFSLSVFEPEAIEGRGVTLRGREKMIESLGLAEMADKKAPLLSEIIRLSKVAVLRSETPTPTEDTNRFLFRVEDETSLDETSLATTQKSSLSKLGASGGIQQGPDVAKTIHSPTASVTPESSMSNFASSTAAAAGKTAIQDHPAYMDSTYVVEKNSNKEDFKPSSLSSLGDLPPLAGGGSKANPSGKSLAPLKRVPPPQKGKDGDKLKSSGGDVQKKDSKGKKDSPLSSLSVEEDIGEDIEEFLNSSVSASDDFTKEETVSEQNSLKADYVEKL